MQEKFAELMKDETFVKELLALENTEEVQKALAEKGVDLSIEEIEEVRKAITFGVSSEEEMNDDQLEQVAGGARINMDIIKKLMEQYTINKPFCLIVGNRR